jgi:TetR/AcrR family transcriptional repressor of lmrAB and yxaGH operons
VKLFQGSGFAGTGINDIVAAAGAPKGSVYHHFPGGKIQLGVEAVQFMSGEVEGLIERRVRDGVPPARILMDIAWAMGGWLERSGWREGCLISVVAQETGPADEELHAAVAASYAAWTSHLRPAIVAQGFDQPQAAELADLAIAALEGGLILARVRRSCEPLSTAARLAGRLMEPPQQDSSEQGQHLH